MPFILEVKPEPARPARRRRHGVDRDQFEIEAVTQAEQAIVGAHALVFAARRKRDSELMFQPRRAGIEVADGENKMIRYSHRWVPREYLGAGRGQVLGFRCTCPWPLPAGR